MRGGRDVWVSGAGRRVALTLNSLRADRRLPLKEGVAGGARAGGESTVNQKLARLGEGEEKGAIKDRRPKSTELPNVYSLVPAAFIE